jgi:hypothetical protein
MVLETAKEVLGDVEAVNVVRFAGTSYLEIVFEDKEKANRSISIDSIKSFKEMTIDTMDEVISDAESVNVVWHQGVSYLDIVFKGQTKPHRSISINSIKSFKTRI